MNAPRFEGTLIRLRPLGSADVPAYVRAFAVDGELANLLGLEEDPTEDRVRTWLDRAWVDPPELRFFEWTIADAKTDAFLGALTIHSCDWPNRRAEIGFWIAPPARGRGVLGAALALALDWAFDVAGIERIEMTALPGNAAVARIAERFGYVYEGTLRRRNFERGRRVDVLIWGLLADEWARGRADDVRSTSRPNGSTSP